MSRTIYVVYVKYFGFHEYFDNNALLFVLGWISCEKKNIYSRMINLSILLDVCLVWIDGRAILEDVY